MLQQELARVDQAPQDVLQAGLGTFRRRQELEALVAFQFCRQSAHRGQIQFLDFDAVVAAGLEQLSRATGGWFVSSST